MTTNAGVAATVKQGFHSKRVLVAGDVMLDRYISGTVDRISPEAPVPVLRSLHTFSLPGGAGNVAMNLAGLGASVSLAGFWGDDPERLALVGDLDKAGIDSRPMVLSSRPTISKTRVVARRQQLLRMDVESDDPFPSPEQQSLLERAMAQVAVADAVILSDYAKGALTAKLCQELIGAARAAGKPVLADPKDRDFRKYAGATTACPNLSEFAAATGLRRPEIPEMVAAGQLMIRETRIEFLTVTLSERGILAILPAGSYLSPARAREVFDVSGAGDTVIATLALSLACGLDLESSLDLANTAAGIVVGKAGTAPVRRDELAAEWSARPARDINPPRN